MQQHLKPVGLAANVPTRKYPIFSFDGRLITLRKTPLKTLGDLLDYGYSVEIQCGCRRSIVEMRASRFLELKEPAPESTLVRDLPDFLVCRHCGEKGDITVRPTEGSYAGIRPRKAGTMRGGYFVPHVPYERAEVLDTPIRPDQLKPRIPSHPRCKRGR